MNKDLLDLVYRLKVDIVQTGLLVKQNQVYQFIKLKFTKQAQ